jgi:uncharacterized membrane protein
MTTVSADTEKLFTLRALALRAAIVGGVIAAAAGWNLAHGGHLTLPAPHWHAPHWNLIAYAPPVIQFHIAAALTALITGSVLLAGVKGTALHKRLGWTWVLAMAATAASSLFIKVINPGHWSFIHFLSGWVLIALPMGVVAIRRRDIRLHRRTMTGLFIGGLIIAGAFTFAPGRLMFRVFFG